MNDPRSEGGFDGVLIAAYLVYSALLGLNWLDLISAYRRNCCITYSKC